jgi:hypothetical protein
MDWKLYAGLAGVAVILGGIALFLRYRDRWVRWFAEYNQKIGAANERAEANRKAQEIGDQARANAENAKRDNQVIPITDAKKKARRKWTKLFE